MCIEEERVGKHLFFFLIVPYTYNISKLENRIVKKFSAHSLNFNISSAFLFPQKNPGANLITCLLFLIFFFSCGLVQVGSGFIFEYFSITLL